MEDGQVKEAVQNQAEEAANSQANKAVENQADNTSDVLEGISKLVGNQKEEVSEETNQPEEPKVEEQAEEVEATKEEPVAEQPVLIIDEKMVEQYPRLKMYLGKSILELPKAYDNVALAYYNDHKKFVELEKQQAKKIPDTKEIPDPIEKPEEFKEWLTKFAESQRELGKQEYQPQQQIDWASEVQKVIPEGLKAQEVIAQWTKLNARRLYDQFGNLRPEPQKFYDEHPEVLLDEISSFASISYQANKNSSTIEQESKKKAYDTVKTSLKKAQENKEDLPQAQFNAVSRSDVSTPEEEILAKIYKIAQGQ